MLSLRDIPNTTLDPVVGPHPRDVLPVEQDAASAGLKQPNGGTKQGGLSRTVVSHHGGDPARRHLDAYPMDHRGPPVSDMDISQLQHQDATSARPR